MKSIKDEVMNETKSLFEELVSTLRRDLVQAIRKELANSPRLPFPNVEDSLLKSGEAAKKLGISTRTLNRWRDSGRINPIRRNGYCYYSQNQINQINEEGFSDQVKPTPTIHESLKKSKSGRKAKFNLSASL